MTASTPPSIYPLRGRDTLPMPGEGGVPNVTRFAPSPTGYLHIGHAYSALFAWEAARRSGGCFVLRIENIDETRCLDAFEQATIDDLAWLGITSDVPIRRQADEFAAYEAALSVLSRRDLIYPCFCTRKQIRAEVEESGRAPHGPSGEVLYPGICRHLADEERDYRIANGEPFAWRLNVDAAMAQTGPLRWYDCRAGWVDCRPDLLGDVVLGRKDTPTSYHLAVTVDDAIQGVNLVTRGEDLYHATHIHRLLQALLDLPAPRWYHHNLVADSRGQRLAKRNRAITLRHLRDLGKSPADVWKLLGLQLG